MRNVENVPSSGPEVASEEESRIAEVGMELQQRILAAQRGEKIEPINTDGLSEKVRKEVEEALEGIVALSENVQEKKEGK